MKKKRILLTGDDGYNSNGTRILVHYLKHEFDLSIAATNSQQSGVGGFVGIRTGGAWGGTTVDGVPALWVSGSPVDAVECAESYFQKPFDLIISGINWGANVSGCIISSGTFAAAYRAMHLGISSKALVLSWSLPSGSWLKNHDGQEDIAKELDYPGKVAQKLITEAVANNFWNADLLNINFPRQPSTQALFTKFYPDITGYYLYPMIMNRITKSFQYTNKFNPHEITDTTFDIGALHEGFISITPCQRDLLSDLVFNKVKNKQVTLITS